MFDDDYGRDYGDENDYGTWDEQLSFDEEDEFYLNEDWEDYDDDDGDEAGFLVAV